MYIKQFFFSIIPFVGFLLGHAYIWHLQKPKTICCPSLIGLSLLEACIEAATQKVDVRVIKTITHDGIPQGSIIYQYPKEKSLIKEQQVIYVFVSVPPLPNYAPNLLTKKIEEAQQLLSNNTLELKTYTLPAPFPVQTIFAQHPLPGKAMQHTILLTYATKEEAPLYVVPNCIGHAVQDVTDIFDLHQIPYTCDHIKQKKDAIILDQRPVPGTIVSKKNLKMVYLHCIP